MHPPAALSSVFPIYCTKLPFQHWVHKQVKNWNFDTKKTNKISLEELPITENKCDFKSNPAPPQTNEEPTAVSRCFWDDHHQDVHLSDRQHRHDRWTTMVQAAMLWYPLIIPSPSQYGADPAYSNAPHWTHSSRAILNLLPSAEAHQRILSIFSFPLSQVTTVPPMWALVGGMSLSLEPLSIITHLSKSIISLSLGFTIPEL